MVKLARRMDANSIISNPSTNSTGNKALDVLVHYIRSKKNEEATQNGNSKYNIDDTDIEIIRQMLAGQSGADIARTTGLPLTTVMRRSRRLSQDGFVVSSTHLNFKKFGLRRGILYLRCKNADLEDAVKRISEIRGIESAGAYLGSLNIIANVVYADSREVLTIIAQIQKLGLINEVTWLEEIYSLPV